MVYWLVAILLVAVAVLWFFRNKGVRVSQVEKDKVYRAWTQIRELQNGDDHALVRAVMDADKLLDWCLQLVGVPGTTMGDRLKNSKGLINNMDGVWNAHKLRNRLAHEIEARPRSSEVHAAVRQFEIAIKRLGFL